MVGAGTMSWRWARWLGLLGWLGLLVLVSSGCGRRPDPYQQQLSRALEAGLRGQELLSEGQTRRAERAFRRALEMQAALDYTPGTARELNNLGAAAAAREDLEQAETFFRQALFINQQLGQRAEAALNLANLAALAEKRGARRQAHQLLSEALTLARSSPTSRIVGQILCQQAGLAIEERDLGTAAALLAEAAPHLPRPPRPGALALPAGPPAPGPGRVPAGPGIFPPSPGRRPGQS
jgi:tetratricopeptide (TPR) repeat protein